MGTKLRFQRGTSRSYLLRFRREDGNPEDLTEAVYAAFIKRCVFDADEEALTDLSARVSVFDALAGTALLSFFPADTAALDPFEPIEWQVRATLADGRVLGHCEHSGPLIFCPCLGPADVAEPPNDFIEAITDMSAFIRILSNLTGLTGGTTGKLDFLPASTLAAMLTGQQVLLSFDGDIDVRYRLRERREDEDEVPAAEGGFVILCDNDSARCWSLRSVEKEGVPCVWNPTTEKWHQILASGSGDGVTASLAQESGAFSLPA